jgi:uncharacterized protein (DUF952 family)
MDTKSETYQKSRSTVEKNLIYHIADSNHWEQAQLTGYYVHPSLHAEGFIHCSTKDQVEETANLYFSSFDDILILFIDANKLENELVYEKGTRGGDFPHVYGPINIDSVERTKKIKRKKDKKFKLDLTA